MNPDRWQRVKQIYNSALDFESSERESFLERTCAGDEELRREVQRLLAREAEAEEFLESPVMEGAAKALAKDELDGRESDFVGQTLLHYRIVERIGEGGMGEVYRARDEHLERDVAIKVLPPGTMSDESARSRFRKEALALSKLNHPNISTVYDFNEHEGRHFIAMEFVAGRTLSRLIGRKGLSLRDALLYAVQIADALGKAHAAGIVHRDLKPTNIMVTGDGLVKILDFGLAKQIGPVPPSDDGTASMNAKHAPLTEAGSILGTVDYMSPEQAEGKPLDERSDIFSFGTVLYEMLTGRRPFSGETSVSTLAAIITRDPMPLSQISVTVPHEVEKVVMRCLRKDPKRRIQTMLDLKVLLLDLKEESDSGRLLAVRVARVPRRGWAWPIVAFFALILIAAGVWVARQISRSSSEANVSALARITFESGISIWPAISMDGKLVAYSSDQTDTFDIYVRQLGSQQAIRRTQDVANDWQPAFSPDGSKIVFRSERDGGGIYIMDTLGGPERKIAEAGYSPSFSPDGRTLLFVVGSPLIGRGRMFLVSADGGEPQPFHPEFWLPRWGWIQQPPVWSPDGQYILFDGMRSGDLKSRDWWLAPSAGGGAVRLGSPAARPGASGRRFFIAWRGNYVYYIEGTWAGVMVIARVALAEDPWRIAGTPEILLEPTGMLWGASVSAEGRIVFSSVQQPIPNIWAVGLQALRGLVFGQPEAVTKDSTNKQEFTVAANSSMLAYAYAAPPIRGIRILDPASGREYQVGSTGSPSGPRLSADGSFLAYGEMAGGKYRSFVIRPGAPAAREVCERCLIQDFFANPAEVLVDYGEKVVRQDVVSGTNVTLMDTSGLELIDMALSPGDRWIAFTMPTPQDTAGLYLSAVGQTPTSQGMWIRIADDSRYVGSPAWSPDGKLLYYASNRDGFTCIWAQRIGGDGNPDGAPFAVYHDHRSSPSTMLAGASRIAVTPDKLYMLLFEFKGSLWSVTLGQDVETAR